jgi:CO dehydrogenase/acetyl-CoA synthase gamma subunit (corrinoid Fe-S protein)
LKRKVAIDVLKEIVEICTRAGVTHIILKPVTESEGFELQIENHFDEKDCERLQAVLQKHNLSMRKYDGNIVIYTLKPI